jgi:hypothetical protein
MSAVQPQLFPEPPLGILYVQSLEQVAANRDLDAYQHLLVRAWDALALSGALIIRGIPTVYLKQTDRALSPLEIAVLHQQFWNQGVATLLVITDPVRTRIFSSMVAPEPFKSVQDGEHARLDAFVEELNLAAQALRAHHAEATQIYHDFCHQVTSGHYYRRPEHATKFNPNEMVDAYLLDNLSAVRDELTCGKGKLDVQTAHAFLGRLLFSCYLIDRRIIELRNYFPEKPWEKLQDVLSGGTADEVFEYLYDTLFPKLKREFNGSMFDEDLAVERSVVKSQHLKAISDFFGGTEIRKNQRSLGFWAYDFQFIPVETISAIYENFLEKESEKEKRDTGAYYTPRFLAEMTLNVALEGDRDLTNKRFLDPSCGSGIFLVLLFNRLASRWSATNPNDRFKSPRAAYAAKDKALRGFLLNLRGIDKNLTACRIACFSLYLAFLDQFTPSDVRAYIQQSDSGKLPNLLLFKDGRARKADIPVVQESDFFRVAEELAKNEAERFDYIIGNPPWAGRGTKQIAHEFMRVVPQLLKNEGHATLLLPTKVFFNKTDEFQSIWLQAITLEKVIQLADYSFILFTNALCPCVIARFNNRKPNINTHNVDYFTPKVNRVDLRQGVIPIAPGDYKTISLRHLLGAAAQKVATMAWKSQFWGTQCDLKFLNHLLALPKLAEIAGTEAQVKSGARRWMAGEGFQPLREITIDNPKKLEWPHSDLIVGATQISGQLFLPKLFASTLGSYLKEREYRLDFLRRSPSEDIYKPPMVLFNRGFTGAAFFDYHVRFQHALRSIAGPKEDEDALLFLASYLRSKLARYFIFHTSASLGAERDQVHSYEVLRLPFYLPTDVNRATPRASILLKQIVKKLRGLKERIEASALKLEFSFNPSSFRLAYADEGSKEEECKKWLEEWGKKTAKVQAEIEPILHEYFGITPQEQILVEETCNIFDKSDTPSTVDAPIPTLFPIEAAEMEPYATTLADTLREWSLNQKLKFSAFASVNTHLGIALLRIEQSKNEYQFQTGSLRTELAAALKRIEQSASTVRAALAYVRDETWFFEGSRIYIAKPALRGRWTQTAALNDSADIHATIQMSRQPNR